MPKLGKRPDDFDEEVVRKTPTFKKWEKLQNGVTISYGSRQFTKGAENDEERLMRRINCAYRNNTKQKKKARAIQQQQQQQQRLGPVPGKVSRPSTFEVYNIDGSTTSYPLDIISSYLNNNNMGVLNQNDNLIIDIPERFDVVCTIEGISHNLEFTGNNRLKVMFDLFSGNYPSSQGRQQLAEAMVSSVISSSGRFLQAHGNGYKILSRSSAVSSVWIALLNRNRSIELRQLKSQIAQRETEYLELISTKRKMAPEGQKNQHCGDVVENSDIVVSKNDVLCGRGGGTNSHPGNIKFRQLVAAHKLRYLAASRSDKPSVALDVVREWRAMTPPGRFLAKTDPELPNDGSNMPVIWHDIGDKKAREKASQCLRERNGAANEAVTMLAKTVIANGESCPKDYDTLLSKAAQVSNQNQSTIRQQSKLLKINEMLNQPDTAMQMMKGIMKGDTLLNPQLAKQLIDTAPKLQEIEDDAPPVQYNDTLIKFSHNPEMDIFGDAPKDVLQQLHINNLKSKRESEQRAKQQHYINGSTSYEILGITEDSTVDDIKAAYCAQALVHHHFRVSDEYKDEAKNKMDMIYEAFSTAMNNEAPRTAVAKKGRSSDACPGSKVKFATERNSTDDCLHLSIGTILPCWNNIMIWGKCTKCYQREEGKYESKIEYQLLRSLITIGYPFIFNKIMRYGEETSKCEADMHFMYDERSCVVEQDDDAHRHYKTKNEFDGLINRAEFVVENGGKYGLTLRNNCREDVIQDHLQVMLIDALIREWKKGVDKRHLFVDMPIIVFIDYKDEDHNTNKHLTAARDKYGDRVFSVHCRDPSNTTNNKLGEEIPDFVELALAKIFPWCRGEGSLV